MCANGSNRSEGWAHAKNTGHENESIVEYELLNNIAFQKKFLEKINKEGNTISFVKFGGINEKSVVSVLSGKTTKTKTDGHIILNDGTRVNISLKKSEAGQVYLITVDNFIDGFEKQFGKKIPKDVIRAMTLYWGTASDTKQILSKYATFPSYEFHKGRLTATTLDKYDNVLCKTLIDWFSANCYEVFLFCFSRGLAKNQDEWANILWYKNEIGENSADDVFIISKFDFSDTSKAEYGKVNGGSTIQLPFGFLQWHNPGNKLPYGSMQFHHKLSCIKLIPYEDR